jgi:hypothetical protein
MHRARLVSQVCVFTWPLLLATYTTPFTVQLRCTAPHHDLEGELGGPHSHLLTEMLMSSGTFTLRELWDDYGIVGDVLVSLSSVSSPPVCLRSWLC